MRDTAPDMGWDERRDSDGDTLADYWETQWGLDPDEFDVPTEDYDNDGLTNFQEADHGSSPLDADSDTDGLADADEILLGTPPMIADSDGDGFLDGQEVASGTNPLNADTDGDGLNDAEDPEPLLNGSASDVALHVTSEGSEQGVIKAGGRHIVIPQGTKGVYYKVTVFSSEYPHYTGQSSEFDDEVTWGIKGPTSGQTKGPHSYNVNSLHSQFGAGPFAGGNVVVDEGVLDYSIPAASSASYLHLTGTAVNVSDNMLGSGVAIQVAVLKVDIAMDGNRDESIDFDGTNDNHCLFWVNDDHDCLHYEEGEWHEDDSLDWADGADTPNCDDDRIGAKGYIGGNPPSSSENHCRRDLEDFTRLHIRVDDNTANLSGITYWMKFENPTSGSPSVNIFEAINEDLDYLENGSIADQQIQKTRLITVGASEVQLPSQYIKTGDQRSPFIIEGKAAGKGDLTIIVKVNGNEVCKKAVTLELRPITKFYQVFQVSTVGQNSTDVSAGYNSDFTSSDDYLLFVHGFNVNATDKAYWPGTVFKRLWWQGYKGHIGWFDWPCVVRDWWDLNPEFFDNSENIAWQCGSALLHRINQLNSGTHAGKVRMMAHSQGNIIAGEALQNAGGVVVQAYIASQAAVGGDHYAVGLPQNPDNYLQPFPTTPNVLAHYPPTGLPYLAGISQSVASQQLFDYFNDADYALRSGTFSWERNNAMKPDLHYNYHEQDGNVDTYQWPNEYFYYDTLLSPMEILDFQDLANADRFRIFAYAAEARTFALGTDVVPGFGSFNLRSMPVPYNQRHYSHSRQLRSNVVDERPYWTRVMTDCGF